MVKTERRCKCVSIHRLISLIVMIDINTLTRNSFNSILVYMDKQMYIYGITSKLKIQFISRNKTQPSKCLLFHLHKNSYLCQLQV